MPGQMLHIDAHAVQYPTIHQYIDIVLRMSFPYWQKDAHTLLSNLRMSFSCYYHISNFKYIMILFRSVIRKITKVPLWIWLKRIYRYTSLKNLHVSQNLQAPVDQPYGKMVSNSRRVDTFLLAMTRHGIKTYATKQSKTNLANVVRMGAYIFIQRENVMQVSMNMMKYHDMHTSPFGKSQQTHVLQVGNACQVWDSTVAQTS